jgi:hypothetical protein
MQILHHWEQILKYFLLQCHWTRLGAAARHPFISNSTYNSSVHATVPALAPDPGQDRLQDLPCLPAQKLQARFSGDVSWSLKMTTCLVISIVKPDTTRVSFVICYREIAGSIPDVTGFFNWPNPSSCTLALRWTQPLTETSTRNASEGKGRPAVKADVTAICEPIV